MNILVIGASGFVGPYLLRGLAEQYKDSQIFTASNTKGFEPELAGVKYLTFDLRDRKSTENLLRECQPNIIFHLAAQSHVPASFKDPELTFDINMMGTLRVLESYESLDVKDKNLIFVSTSDIYGNTFKEGLVTEKSRLSPLNPYSSSKAAADLLVQQYGNTSSIKTVCVRPFNHIGPGQTENFVVSAFAKQVAEISLGLKSPEISVGDLTPERNFLDVRDVVSGYLKLIDVIDQIESGSVFNICSKESTPIQNILNALIKISEVDAKVSQDPDRMRPSDIAVVKASSEVFRQKTGWKEEYSLEETLKDIFDFWKKSLSVLPSDKNN